MTSVKSFVFAAVILAAGAALACKCIEFKNTTAIMATPTFGSAYVTLVSDKNDTLTSLNSTCCDAVELHKTSMENGVMQMRKLDELPLTAGVPVEIAGEDGAGDSMHLMLIGVHKEMKPGQKFSITFHFAKEAPHKAIFTVIERAAKTTH